MLNGGNYVLHWEEIQNGGQPLWGSEVPLAYQTVKRSSTVRTGNLGNQVGYPCIAPFSMNAAHD